MSAEDPTGLIAGVTEGTLNYAEEKAKALLARFFNRDLAFIEDSETIELVRSPTVRDPPPRLFKGGLLHAKSFYVLKHIIPPRS